MIGEADKVKFRSCQECGQVEKVTPAEVGVPEQHPDNKQENWVDFTAEPDWRPVDGALVELGLKVRK